MALVSVIVPVYNVSAFIRRCAESLMRQTLADVEFIFVDDASPDDSVEILKRTLSCYLDRDVTIVTHEFNKGLPSARNTGLSIATGDYIFHCDSDDYLETDALEILYKKAKEDNADMVWGDFYLTFLKNERYMTVGGYDTPNDVLRAMLSGSMKYNVWNKLVRRALYTNNEIVFPDRHGMGEDMTMIMLASCAKKVAYVPKPVYHYVKLNTNAFSSTFSNKHLVDIRFNADRIIAFLKERKGELLEEDVAIFKLSIKFPFLITDDEKMYRLWEEWYPESNKYITKNRSISFRSKILQIAAEHHQFWFVKCYYRIIIKLVYGLLYK